MSSIPDETFDEIIIVIVGNDISGPRSFNIHKDVLTKTSHYFQAAVKQKWNKSLPRVIRSENAEAELFYRYACWPYRRHGRLQLCAPGAPEPFDGVVWWQAVLDQSIIAEFMLDVAFKEAVASTVETQSCYSGYRTKFRHVTPISSRLCEIASSGCSVRRVWVAYTAENMSHRYLITHLAVECMEQWLEQPDSGPPGP